MDLVIENIFINSKLSDKFKNNLISLLKEYIDNDYGYLSVGDAYELVKSLIILEKDLENIELSDDTTKSLIYNYVRKFCVSEKQDFNNKIIVWRKMYELLIKDTLFNYKNRRKFININNPESGIIIFIKNLAVELEELVVLIKQNKNLLVLKKYQQIINLCNNMGFSPDIINDDIKLKEELEKRFSIYSTFRHPNNFKKEINKKELSEEKEYAPDNFIYVKNPNFESVMTQELLHKQMKWFYEQTGYILRPFNNDINIFYLKDIIIVAYKNDDAPNTILKSGKLTLGWHDRDYWAKIFDPDCNYVEGPDFNYFIEDESRLEFYKLVPLNFQTKFFKKLGSKIIYAPEEYIDEALYNYITEKGTKNLSDNYKKSLELIGLDYNNITNKLMTTDYSFYFKDPHLVDELKVENDYKYLNMIKSKTDKKSRNRSIASIIMHSKKNPKVVPEEKKIYEMKKVYKPEIKWLPYKDN